MLADVFVSTGTKVGQCLERRLEKANQKKHATVEAVMMHSSSQVTMKITIPAPENPTAIDFERRQNDSSPAKKTPIMIISKIMTVSHLKFRFRKILTSIWFCLAYGYLQSWESAGLP